MAKLQRYISDELTHFLGTNLESDEKRYELLIKIIQEKCLTGNPSNPDICSLSMSFGTPKMSKNEVFNANKVCFCDIPIEDLDLHMNKYSYFGLSFSKKYLIEKGANPVFYISNNSKILYNKKNRGHYFDEIVDGYSVLCDQLEKYLKRHNENSAQILDSWHSMIVFLNFYIFSFVQCFDDTKKDEDPDNFYMEREWRLLGSLKFNINDICRIILPREYSRRFRTDVSDYFGQVTFPHLVE